MNRKAKWLSMALGLALLTVPFGAAVTASAAKAAPLVIAEQGVFSAGGKVVTSPGTFVPEDQWEETGRGQTAHVDHANVLYQRPVKEKGLPMVFLHGYGQSRTGWITTPGIISDKTLDQRWYTQFRIGRWENGRSVANAGSKFPNDDHSVDQFFRQMTPDTGMKSDMGADFQHETVATAIAASIDAASAQTGRDAVLVTHSQGGRAGWKVPAHTPHVAAIVAVEPGGAPEVGSADYQSLVEKKIPVLFLFGDYIDNGDPKLQATAAWQRMRQTCYDFAKAYTEAGLMAEVIDLPKVGFTGNDHFIFEDTNSAEVAAFVEDWLKKHVK
ncbi:MAG: alpha/beta fold hydrolase [Selenomonas sp.]|nr:alpha/beta fold hydrolase [Selenomonas sp.]